MIKNMQQDERGLVSIIVTVVLMIVISVTVLSFSQIIRREQRRALDSQLSSQAFYAAESGINDTRNYIASPLHLKGVPITKTMCGKVSPYQDLSMNVSSSNGVSYTCILVDSAPKTLKYSLSDSQPSTIFPVTPVLGSLDSLKLNWVTPGNTNPLSGCPASAGGSLPAANNWPCGYGIMRIDLVPVNDGMTRQSLMANTFTAFMEPTTTSEGNSKVSYTGSGNNISGGTAAQDIRVPASCDNNACQATITNLPLGTKFYARVSTIYRSADLTLAPTLAGLPVQLKDAQYMIDSTGKAQDVLRRMQVRIPIYYKGLHADNGVTSNDSLCKQFTTFPGYSNDSGC